MADLLVHHWSHPTTPAGVGWDTVISNSVRLTTEKGFAARAALGEAEVIRVIVDDPAGAYDFKTLHRWYMVETATPGQQLVWNGYISDQFIDSGETGDLIFPTGTGRRWELELTQENTLLGFRVVQGAATAANGKRPAESPGARLAWLLASNFLSTVVDHGLIDWTTLNAQPDMDAVDYRGQFASDVLRDISLKTGLNHYARYRDASSDIELAFYNPNTSVLDTSTLRVSNIEADIDHATTWPPFFAGYRLHRKGDRVSAGVLVQGDGIQSYDYSLPTSYEFGFRDMVAPDANTKSQAVADRLRDRLLAQHSEQDERITGLRIQVPAANLNDVKHGQRMQAKFRQFPGWEDFRWARVISKAFSRPENDTQALYDVDLELSPMTTCAGSFQLVTPTGYYSELNNRVDNISTSDATGNIMYVVPGYGYSMVPVPFFAGTHHFGVVNIVDAGARGGKFDAMPANVFNQIRCAVVGPGRITVHTRVWADKNPLSTYTATLEYGIAEGEEHEIRTGLAVGSSATFEVPDDKHCNHVVTIETEGGPDNGVGFDGFDWISYA